MRKYHCPELPYKSQVWRWRFDLQCAGWGDGRWVRRGVCCGIKKRRPLSRLLSVMSVGYVDYYWVLMQRIKQASAPPLLYTLTCDIEMKSNVS